jgi:colanic acid biosynthesis glycosyl transferase WcaI
MYSAADVLLLNQKATVEDSVIPSKLLTYMAAGRPVLAAVSERSEAARQIRDAQCGLSVAAEDPKGLVEAVSLLRRDLILRQRLGANGRAYADLHFTKQKVLQEYGLLFRRYADGKEAEPEVSEKAAAAR